MSETKEKVKQPALTIKKVKRWSVTLNGKWYGMFQTKRKASQFVKDQQTVQEKLDAIPVVLVNTPTTDSTPLQAVPMTASQGPVA